MKVKICGLTRPEDITAVNRCRPDYAGFVFAPGKRRLTPEKARELRKILLPEILSAGVFVNSPIKDILSLAQDRIISLIQLHGDEDSAYILELKKLLPPSVPVIKAIRVQSAEDMLRAETFPADYLLFDTYTKGIYGGSGRTFDWSIIPDINKPWFLAGGIGFSNIKEAVKTKAFCLDLSSSLETEGKKDPEKIKKIMKIIKDSEKRETIYRINHKE